MTLDKRQAMFAVLDRGQASLKLCSRDHHSRLASPRGLETHSTPGSGYSSFLAVFSLTAWICPSLCPQPFSKSARSATTRALIVFVLSELLRRLFLNPIKVRLSLLEGQLRCLDNWHSGFVDFQLSNQCSSVPDGGGSPFDVECILGLDHSACGAWLAAETAVPNALLFAEASQSQLPRDRELP